MQRVAANLFRIPIPVPFPMKYVYCYLFKGTDGCTIVDAGLNYPPAQAAWKEVFLQLELHPRRVKSIYITHFHPDHFGMAGWLQEWTGAPVYMGETEMAMVDRAWRNASLQAERVGDMCREHGTPEELSAQIVEHMLKLGKHVFPLPELEVMPPREVRITEEKWQVVHTPGHSDGHVCFYHPEKKWLLAGDHLLDKITPNISKWPGCNPNPLNDYLQSLEQVSSMDISLALPAHGGLISDVRGRVAEIVKHHEQRLNRMEALAAPGRTAYEVASEVFREKQLNPHQWRFAMAETIAHLDYLALQNRLKRENGKGVTLYRKGDMASA